MNSCINILIICFPKCLLINFNKFLLSFRLIFAPQLSLDQFFVVLILNHSALDTIVQTQVPPKKVIGSGRITGHAFSRLGGA